MASSDILSICVDIDGYFASSASGCFTYICGQRWKSGKFLVLRKTIRQRLSAKLRALKEELRRRRHLSVAELGKWLRSVVQGYFNSTIMRFPGIWPVFEVFGYR
ncbi:MAG: hypothetical protein DMG38_28650 [Acidobacteria bacterium]|nr:MAG: hypothetical protein DMG38_28650 [Acidobacteriota bacterium]